MAAFKLEGSDEEQHRTGREETEVQKLCDVTWDLHRGALKFLAALLRTFESTRQSLLVAREDAQRRFDSGVPLDFPPETAHIRVDPSWLCAPPAPGLEDRRVEITGPTDRKMVINALNSGAKTFMADFEGMLFYSSFFKRTWWLLLKIRVHLRFRTW